MIVSGQSPDGRLVEIVELRDHPWFVASQFHPEFRAGRTARIRCSTGSWAPRSRSARAASRTCARDTTRGVRRFRRPTKERRPGSRRWMRRPTRSEGPE